MTIKQKFSSIDQSKLTADQKSFLDKIKNVTKNFSDAEMNKKVEQPLDNFISKAKEKMPEAIKSAPVKKTASAKPSQTRKPKRTAMSLAKEIRKEGESWNDARARASKMMKEDSKDLSKTVETELDKLSKLVKSQKDRAKLSGLSGTNIKRDSARRAKPKGRRVSKDGNIYYENRDNRTDRLAPNYPKNSPFLAEGGYLTDPTFGTFQNQVFAEGGDIDAFTLRMVKSNGVQPAEMLKEDANVKYARGGFFGTSRPKSALMRDRKNVNHSEDYEVRYSKPRPSRSGYSGNRRFAGGGKVESLTKELHRLQRELNSSRLSTYREGDVSQEAIDRKNEREVKLARFNQVLKELRESDAKFELGGTMATDLAGHTGGGDAGLNAGMPLNGFSNTSYTGLVGETGAMSSGEMFMAGGTVNSKRMGDYVGKHFIWRNHIYYIVAFKKYVNRVANPYNRDKKTTGSLKGSHFEPHFTVFQIRLKESMPIDDPNQRVVDFSVQNWEVDDMFDYINNKRKIKISNEKLPSKVKEFLDSKKELIYIHKKAKYELGGGLPEFSQQSYMITEALGNPAQHFAKGGGVRIINGKEYATGRNWTNDHRHVNKGEEHEVSYNRKGKFMGIFEGGGDINVLPFYLLKKGMSDKEQENVDIIYDAILTDNYKDVPKGYSLKPLKSYRASGMNFLIVEVTPPNGNKFNLKVYTYELRDINSDKLNKGGSVTNERKHVNHDEDYEVRYAKPRASRKGYKGARKFMAGGSMETPRIYVADLEAYNSGRLVGEWLDLADYDNADELMDAIQDVLKQSGGEEYAIHDVEYVPSSMYSEYMGKRDFEQLYEMMDLAKQNDLPLEVIQDVVSQYGEGAVEEFVGKYDSATDFAQELVDDTGIESFNDFQYYLDVYETDRRLLSQEMADSYVDDIVGEDGGNRIIEEAGLNVDEYEDASDETREELIDLARSMVYDEYYDTWYEGLNDPYNFLVEEQGLYDAESFAKASFVRVDYDKLAEALEQDYTMISYDGDVYVFNIR